MSSKKQATLAEIFDTTFLNRWAGRAREEVEQRNITFWLKNLPKTTRGLSLGTIDKVIRDEIAKGNKPSTINSKLQTLKTALDFTRERGMHDVGLKVPRLKQGNDARIGFFSAEDQAHIESLIECDRFRDFFVWSIETGLRPSESLGLNSKMIRKDPVVGAVIDVIKTKNGEPRTIPLTKKALECLERRQSWAEFTGIRITREWRKLRGKDSSLGRFVFYTCRHTCATRLLSRGVNVKVVQSWMGHKDITMTLRYAKLVPTDLAAARDLMDNA
jgi:integrase